MNLARLILNDSRMSNKAVLLFFVVLIFLPGNLLAQTKSYEDFLEHRSGFTNKVTGGAGGDVVVITNLEDGSFKTALESKGAKWIESKRKK